MAYFLDPLGFLDPFFLDPFGFLGPDPPPLGFPFGASAESATQNTTRTARITETLISKTQINRIGRDGTRYVKSNY